MRERYATAATATWSAGDEPSLPVANKWAARDAVLLSSTQVGVWQTMAPAPLDSPRMGGKFMDMGI